MTTLRFLLADQLSYTVSALRDLNKATDIVMLCEVNAEATYVEHHPKKIAFLFSAMRHFAAELASKEVRIRYVKLDDAENRGDLMAELQRACAELKPERLVLTAPGEWRVRELYDSLAETLGIPVEIRDDDRFLCSAAEFAAWSRTTTQPRMEFFYRAMRKRYDFLMKDGKPVGGQWNYDQENRKAPVKGLTSPPRVSHRKDTITREVLALVEQRFGHHFGDLYPFHYAVTRKQALKEAKHFIDHLLPQFGDYQDAMVTGEAYLYHSLLSSYINAGLLLPLEICKIAEFAYYAGHAPLNAVEGFIRQILGWREYVRGIYWQRMPDYASLNHLDATRPVPDLYWGGPTKMHCLAEAVAHTREHAYSHHIQRLMVTGNFAMLAGLLPEEVCRWYLEVYSDAYEWVELPNTLGMALYADGGIMGSKPYAASGKYISRMSDFCKGCEYDPNEMLGDTACPFNALYWDFLARNEASLRPVHRMGYTYISWDRMSDERKSDIRKQAATHLARMAKGTL